MSKFPLHLILLLGTAINTPAASWLAISPDPALTTALQPLAEHRRAQGFEVTIANTSVEEAIVTHGSPPDFLIIIGDDKLVPSKRGNLYRWLSTQNETFAADPLFSDLDNDGIPEFPVGRIPAETPDQLSAVVAKIIAYEKRALDLDDLNLPVWFGTPAYGKLLDETADWLLMSTIDKHVPRWAEPWLITANPDNTLNAWPQEQGNLFNNQIQKGGIITAMMGHGDTDVFLSMLGQSTPLGRQDIVYTSRHTHLLDTPEAISPPLVIFACDCGNYADPEKESLAAAFLLKTGGPVATIAATTQSHPLTNYYSSIALMQALDSPSPPERTGDLWLVAQLNAQQMRKPLIEKILKNAEGSLEVEIDIPKLKRDQLQMYTYLGDPALHLGIPGKLEASVSKNPDGTWSWSIEKPTGDFSLIVQLRPTSEALRIKPKGSTREQSLTLFQKRNAQFAFKTLEELKPTDPWSGKIISPGDLRLVAKSSKRILVHTKKLR